MKNLWKIGKLSCLFMMCAATLSFYACSDDEEQQDVKVTSVTLDKDAYTLEIGETVTLEATIAPEDATNQNVAWTSTNTKVATVKDGVVTAVAEGETDIKVVTEDGAKTDVCQITVKRKTVLVTSVALDKTEATLTLGEEGKETVQLTATINPENADNKEVKWSTSDEKIATVSAEGLVTAVAAGTATITVTTEDGSKTATCTVTVRAQSFVSDAKFLEALLAIEGIDADKDGYITEAEAAAYTGAINVNGKEIASLAGIEKFTQITGLDCSNNSLTELDVTKNIALKGLECYSNNIEVLDLKQNTNLTVVKCYDNKLVSIDVSNVTNAMTALEYGKQKNEQKIYVLVNENRIRNIMDAVKTGENNTSAAYFSFQSSKDGKGFSSLNNDITFTTSEVRYIKIARQPSLQGFGNFNPKQENWTVPTVSGLTQEYYDTSTNASYPNVTVKLSSAAAISATPYEISYTFKDNDGNEITKFTKTFTLTVK